MVAQRQLRWRRSDARVTEEIHFYGMTAAVGAASESASLILELPSTLNQIEILKVEPAGFDAETREYLNSIALAMADSIL
jgi:hypothetical protein